MSSPRELGLITQESVQLTNFWRCVALCHDVMVVQTEGSKESLSGSSQDELVMLETLKESKIGSLAERTADTVSISLYGKREDY